MYTWLANAIDAVKSIGRNAKDTKLVNKLVSWRTGVLHKSSHGDIRHLAMGRHIEVPKSWYIKGSAAVFDPGHGAGRVIEALTLQALEDAKPNLENLG